ncbi:hypothetical protein GR304_08150 [Microvirga sp. SYSU G3D207]|uniref:Uncharacterized protein n=2 Tax=Microvirga arsenatis TaxID=2692265 RepID=A0ABW9YXH5_9HYPH|nr:hypothetical protein [Microvirga arsenatis]NBJ24220.1 hypothetical protein [Microvirga arsenatis]
MLSRTRSNRPSLPIPVQEHLGRMLRADYFERSDKPQYVGDPALPLEFIPHLDRLARSEHTARLNRIREQGRKAVADALSGLVL